MIIQHRTNRNQRWQCLNKQNLSLRRRRTVNTRNRYTAQEEVLQLLSKHGIWVDKAPDETGGEEAVIEALVGGEDFGGGGVVRLHAESAVAAGGVPVEHWES